MFKQFLLVAAIASLTLATSSKADCEYALERGASASRVRFRCILMQLNLRKPCWMTL